MDDRPSAHTVVQSSFHRIASNKNDLNASPDSLLSYIHHWKLTKILNKREKKEEKTHKNHINTRTMYEFNQRLTFNENQLLKSLHKLFFYTIILIEIQSV